MNHLTEEDLVLQYYGEPAEDRHTASHLAACTTCATRFQELQRVLNSLGDSAVPDRPEDYGTEVWTRVRPKLQAHRPAIHWHAWGAVAAMLVLGVAGFLLGRSSSSATSDTVVKERILLVALTDHFERSRMVLAEIENADDGKPGRMDFAFERSQAEDLLDANRLYRMTAFANGDLAAAGLLDDLERVLIDIAHSPEQVTREQMEGLRSRIEDQGLTFKVKVFSTGLANQDKGRL